MTTLLPSTLRHHIVAALRSGGESLRDRVTTPSLDFPLHVIEHDMHDIELSEDQTGAKVTLRPGAWFFSSESIDPLSKWDSNNIQSIWVFEGSVDLWCHVFETNTPDDNHLLLMLADASGFAPWKFVVPRSMTANTFAESVHIIGEGETPGGTGESEMFMYMDVSLVGRFVSHLSQSFMHVSTATLRDHAEPGFAPLLDEALNLTDLTRLLNDSAPLTADRHMRRTLDVRMPGFPYARRITTAPLPVRALTDAAHREAGIAALENELAVAVYDPSVVISAPLGDGTGWLPHDLVSVTFFEMEPSYWVERNRTEPDGFLLCSIATINGPRDWFYTVRRRMSVHRPETKLHAVAFRPGIQAATEVVRMDRALITVIGYMNHYRRGTLLDWGSIQLHNPAAPSPDNWMRKLLENTVPRKV